MLILKEKDITLVILIIISNISSYIQSYEIYKKKTSKNVPMFTWVISLIANILWILYCFRHNETGAILIQSILLHKINHKLKIFHVKKLN